eukprot:scaffold280170_cov67-Attheya_sp.AAC.1
MAIPNCCPQRGRPWLKRELPGQGDGDSLSCPGQIQCWSVGFASHEVGLSPDSMELLAITCQDVTHMARAPPVVEVEPNVVTASSAAGLSSVTRLLWHSPAAILGVSLPPFRQAGVRSFDQMKFMLASLEIREAL